MSQQRLSLATPPIPPVTKGFTPFESSRRILELLASVAGADAETLETVDKLLFRSPQGLLLEDRVTLNAREKGLFENMAIEVGVLLNSQGYQVKAVKIQAAWRFVRERKRLNEIRRCFTFGRHDVFQDLLRMENSYQRSLDRIVNEFLIPVRNSLDPDIRQHAADFQTIFSNIDELEAFHRSFNRLLNDFANKKWPNVNGVGEVFLHMIPFFKAYEQYASTCSISFTLLEDVLKNSPKFAQLHQQKKALLTVDLKDLLQRPLDQIEGYHSHLLRMLKAISKKPIAFTDDFENGTEAMARRGSRRFGADLNLGTVVDDEDDLHSLTVAVHLLRDLVEKMSRWTERSQSNAKLLNFQKILLQSSKTEFQLLDPSSVSFQSSALRETDQPSIPSITTTSASSSSSSSSSASSSPSSSPTVPTLSTSNSSTSILLSLVQSSATSALQNYLSSSQEKALSIADNARRRYIKDGFFEVSPLKMSGGVPKVSTKRHYLFLCSDICVVTKFTTRDQRHEVLSVFEWPSVSAVQEIESLTSSSSSSSSSSGQTGPSGFSISVQSPSSSFSKLSGTLGSARGERQASIESLVSPRMTKTSRTNSSKRISALTLSGNSSPSSNSSSSKSRIFKFYTQSASDIKEWVTTIQNLVAWSNNTLFGVDLRFLLVREERKVPRFLYQCRDFFEKRGSFNEPGFFRVPGESKRETILKNRINQEGVEKVNLLTEPGLTSADVATLFKSYFRELPEPIFGPTFYKDLIVLQNKIEKGQLQKEAEIEKEFKTLAQTVPVYKRATAKFVLELMNRTGKNHKVNHMTMENLATCLGPDLLQPKIDTLEDARDVPVANQALAMLFHLGPALFAPSATDLSAAAPVTVPKSLTHRDVPMLEVSSART